MAGGLLFLVDKPCSRAGTKTSCSGTTSSGQELPSLKVGTLYFPSLYLRYQGAPERPTGQIGLASPLTNTSIIIYRCIRLAR